MCPYIFLPLCITIIPGSVCVLVAVPERIQFPAEVRFPAAVSKTRIDVSERRPQFEKRILEERRPPTQTHVNDDWFVLLDVGLKESGTSLGLLFFPQIDRSHVFTLPSLRQTLGNVFSLFYRIRRLSLHRGRLTIVCGPLMVRRLKTLCFPNLSISPVQPH